MRIDSPNGIQGIDVNFSQGHTVSPQTTKEIYDIAVKTKDSIVYLYDQLDGSEKEQKNI